MSANDFVQRGRSLVERGKFSEAVRVCRLGLLANPTDVDGRIVLATALLAMRRYDEVLAEMRVALEVDANNVDSLALRGEALLRKDEPAQAVEVFDKALAIDSSNARIRALNEEAKLALTRTDSGAAALAYADQLDQMTKHYPSHRGNDSAGKPLPGDVTRPSDATKVTTPPPNMLTVGDRSGTIELDPDIEGVEFLDDPPIEPPVGRQPVLRAPSESDIMELDPDDLIDDLSGAVELPREPVSARGLAQTGSVAMGQPRSSVQEPTVRARAPKGRGRDYGTSVGTSPESPLSKSGFASPEAMSNSGDAIDDLFPEDESGVSQVELVPPPGIAAALGHDDPDLFHAAPGARVRSQSEDMRTIRAGLGMASTGRGKPGKLPKGAKPGRRAPRLPPKGKPATAEPSTARYKKRADSKARDERTETISKARKKRAGTQTVDGGHKSMLLIYGLVAVVVVGASIFAGLKIRQIRLERQIRSVRSEAVKHSANDTYVGYIKARKAYANIVGVKKTGATKARLALMDAAIAAEFGEEIPRAEKSVSAVEKSSNQDALAARVYLAIARQDAAAVKQLADTFVKDHSDDPLGYYFLGRASLLSRAPADAVKHFREALDTSKKASKPRRPLYWIGLGRAQAAAGETRAAKLSFEEALRSEARHPTALLHRARALIAIKPLPDDAKQLDRVLEDLIVEAKKPIGEQELGVSAEQGGWAVLTLAELALARGDKKEAKRNLARETQWRPQNNWVYSEALAKAYFAVGEAEKAQREIAKVLGKGNRLELQLLLARLELQRKRPAQALAALEKAGDLSKRPEALAMRGQARLAMGKLDAAIDDLDKALAQNKDLPAARTARATAYGRKLIKAKAAGGTALKELAKRLAELTKTDDSLALAVINASVLRLSGDLRAAIAELDRVIDKLGNKPPVGMAYLERARVRRAKGQRTLATRDYAKAIEKLDDAIEARLETATLAIDMGNASGALEGLAALAKDAPKNVMVMTQLGRAQTLNGKVDEGKKSLDAAVALKGAPPWLLAREQGRNAARRGDLAGAVGLLEKSIQLNPDDTQTRLLLIDIHMIREDKAAVKDAQAKVKSRAAFAGRAVVQLAIGRFAVHGYRFNDAAKAFKKARQLLTKERATPRRMADVAVWIGRVHMYKEKYLAAFKQLIAAIRIEPTNSEAHMVLGLYYLERKKWRAAAKSTKRATELNPGGDPNTWFNLGDVYVKLRNKKKAREAYKMVLKLVPKTELAGSARDELKRLR